MHKGKSRETLKIDIIMSVTKLAARGVDPVVRLMVPGPRNCRGRRSESTQEKKGQDAGKGEGHKGETAKEKKEKKKKEGMRRGEERKKIEGGGRVLSVWDDGESPE